MTSHDEFSASLAAYALDALEEADRIALEAHLGACRACQDELTALRRASIVIGMSNAPEPPPASLRARVLERATSAAPLATPRPDSANGRGGMAPRAWMLVAAASLAVAVGAVLYAMSLRAELLSVRELAAAASDRVETLRTELMRLRQDAARLQRVVAVIHAPDLRQARLAGAGAATGASGLALWSQTAGLVLSINKLPQPSTDQSYELWAIPAGAKPISLGTLTVSPDGTASHSAPLAPGLTPDTIAVTIEQAGGSPTGQPHGDLVLSGKLAN